ncbi:MAG TPA: hypothetical protein VH459_10195, partial [Gaiellales bacterium]
NHVYNEQMEEIFRRHGLSWARWDMDCVSTFGLVSHGTLNEQGRWLASEILGTGEVSSVEQRARGRWTIRDDGSVQLS